MKCIIGWVDEQNENTRDNHDAVGFAFTRLQGLISGSESMYWPICQAHLEMLRAFPPEYGWHFEPLTLDASVE